MSSGLVAAVGGSAYCLLPLRPAAQRTHSTQARQPHAASRRLPRVPRAAYGRSVEQQLPALEAEIAKLRAPAA